MPAQKTKIVIIDDEEDLCFLLSNLLTAQGFEVSTFFTLSSGLEGIETVKPSWIIIDNDLPDGSGWEKTNLILDAMPDVNIIKISANPDSTRTNHQPNVHYLIKPIHVNSIVELIPKATASS